MEELNEIRERNAKFNNKNIAIGSHITKWGVRITINYAYHSPSNKLIPDSPPAGSVFSSSIIGLGTI